jgi:hypothetical protein
MTLDDDIAAIELWLKATRTTESRLGLLASANPRAVDRIRDGTAQIETLRQVAAYVRANPPKGKNRG